MQSEMRLVRKVAIRQLVHYSKSQTKESAKGSNCAYLHFIGLERVIF